MKVNTKKTEVALKAASTEISSFVVDAQAQVEKLVERFGTLVPVATTPEGYAHCKEVRAELLPIKTNLENARKSLKDPIIQAGKLVDASIKPLAEIVEGLYKPFEKAYRDVDKEKKERESKRQEFIFRNLAHFDAVLVSAVGATAIVIESLIDDLSDFSIDPKIFMEREPEAREKYLDTMNRLNTMLDQAVLNDQILQKQIEMEEKEAAMLKREAEFNRREELEATKVRDNERAEEMREESEKAAKNAKEKAESEHAEYIKAQELKLIQAKEQAAVNERLRIKEESDRLKAESEAREADKKHKGQVHKDILTLFMSSGATEAQCKEIIKLIAQRRINNISIQY